MWLDPRLSEYGTPAHAAAKANYKKCLVLMLAYGANLSATDLEGQTLLRCINGNVNKTVSELIKEAGK